MGSAWAGLSGSGFQAFTGVAYPVFERVAITSVGGGVPMQMTDPSRYLHLGYWAMYDEDTGDPTVPSGLYIHQFHFLTFLRESWTDDRSLTAGGFLGFFYNLDPGVVATFWMYGSGL